MAGDDIEIDSVSAELSNNDPTREQEILCHLLDDVTFEGVDHGFAQFIIATVLDDEYALSDSHDFQLREYVLKYRAQIQRNVVNHGIIDPEIQDEIGGDPYEFLEETFEKCREGL